MLQETHARLENIDVAAPIVVCNEEHRFLVAEQMREINVATAAMILEPEGRNTAPAIALAAIKALEEDADALVLILPADHYIPDKDAFSLAVKAALEEARGGRLMTFGVVPDRPETGFGYIRCGELLSEHIFELSSFVEKPDRATAKAYLEEGTYLWNSGMFLFRADCYLDTLAEYQPAIAEGCRQAMAGAMVDMDFLRPDKEAFWPVPRIVSITRSWRKPMQGR